MLHEEDVGDVGGPAERFVLVGRPHSGFAERLEGGIARDVLVVDAALPRGRDRVAARGAVQAEVDDLIAPAGEGEEVLARFLVRHDAGSPDEHERAVPDGHAHLADLGASVAQQGCAVDIDSAFLQSVKKGPLPLLQCFLHCILGVASGVPSREGAGRVVQKRRSVNEAEAGNLLQ